MKPIIGLNIDINRKNQNDACYTILKDYIVAIEKASGIPLLLPPMVKEDLTPLLSKIQGMMFIGGNDYNPKLYGETANDKVPKTTTIARDDAATFASGAHKAHEFGASVPPHPHAPLHAFPKIGQPAMAPLSK